MVVVPIVPFSMGNQISSFEASTEKDGVHNLGLTDSDTTAEIFSIAPGSGSRALEDDSFPFEALSEIAEAESWRKEINRPPYHIHKWWAQRLGTVFRAIVIGALAPSGANVLDLFYKPVRIRDAVVFDPFMGSGTTIGEVCKIGARAIGRDINPVAHFLARNAFALHDKNAILRTYTSIERDIADQVRRYYRATLPDGSCVDVLYYFWVKTVNCPSCDSPVDLFSSRIFAQHAYPKKFTAAQSICPNCDGINVVPNDSQEVRCNTCKSVYNPQIGPAKGQKATCPSCSHVFPIAKTIRSARISPRHRMYAKLVLMPDGSKAYLAADSEDRVLYEVALSHLSKLENAYPIVRIEPGNNTDQARGYNYFYWHEMFNGRQLLCLSILANRIRRIQDRQLRELFACLFSGTLEFNNMFASFKGEGTGAVRHMFAHHILKPERMPLEANLWGTPKSSGAFSTLFKRRILRALEYSDNPFEIHPGKFNGTTRNGKVFGLSQKIGYSIVEDYATFNDGGQLYLSCGDSARTDLPDAEVDAVITDPPFFDNVHYSQLADFFFVWQQHILEEHAPHVSTTTRSEREVQHAEADTFTERLIAVWSEVHRVLRDEGILAFTYHHSRPEGWSAVLEALWTTKFEITAAHPIKSELSVAMPKHQAKEPINLDVVVVCRKKSTNELQINRADLWKFVLTVVTSQVRRLRGADRQLSLGDIRVIVMAQLIRQLSKFEDRGEALFVLETSISRVEELVYELQSDRVDSRLLTNRS